MKNNDRTANRGSRWIRAHGINLAVINLCLLTQPLLQAQITIDWIGFGAGCVSDGPLQAEMGSLPLRSLT